MQSIVKNQNPYYW